MKRCLICEKELEDSDCGNNVESAGQLIASFDYGSRYDHLGYRTPIPENTTPVDKMAACHEIVAYICDDCFEKRCHLFEGYKYEDVTEVVTEKDQDGVMYVRNRSQHVCTRSGRDGGVRWGWLCERKLKIPIEP